MDFLRSKLELQSNRSGIVLEQQRKSFKLAIYKTPQRSYQKIAFVLKAITLDNFNLRDPDSFLVACQLANAAKNTIITRH